MNNLEKYYVSLEDMASYVEDTESGAMRQKQFVEFYEKHKNIFGKKVLDLCCGGGIVANYLARQGHEVTAVDYLEILLERARKNAPSKENPKYICADVSTYEISEDYDTVIIWGNSIAHFSPVQLADLFKRIKKRTKYLVLEYSDFISFGFTDNLKKLIVEKTENGKLALDIYSSYDGENSRMIKYCFVPEDKDLFEFFVYLHNPGHVSGLLTALDYTLEKRIPTFRFFGSGAPSCIDIWVSQK